MSTTLSLEPRISICTFTFADGRRCRTPRTARHQYLCTYHARKDAQARAAEKVGEDIGYDLSGKFTTANDLTAALAHLFSAVAQGHIKPKTANTLAYLGQTLVQSVQLAQNEFIKTFGERSWRGEIEGHLFPKDSEAEPESASQPTQVSEPVAVPVSDQNAYPEPAVQDSADGDTESDE
jgi:hypothetical protein